MDAAELKRLVDDYRDKLWRYGHAAHDVEAKDVKAGEVVRARKELDEAIERAC